MTNHSITNPEEPRLKALNERLDKYGVSVVENSEDDGYIVYWPDRLNIPSRPFESLDDIEEWVRQDLPDWFRGDTRNVLYGVAEIIRLFDGDEPRVNDEGMLVHALHRLIEAGVADLERIEMLEMERNRRERSEQRDAEAAGDDPDQRPECIRLQAERVVKARDALRGSFKKAGDDEFPMFALSELLTEIERLGGWLEPAESRTPE